MTLAFVLIACVFGVMSAHASLDVKQAGSDSGFLDEDNIYLSVRCPLVERLSKFYSFTSRIACPLEAGFVHVQKIKELRHLL
jgi:hypothetical protein